MLSIFTFLYIYMLPDKETSSLEWEFIRFH